MPSSHLWTRSIIPIVSDNRSIFDAFKLLLETLESNGEVFDDSVAEVKAVIASYGI